MIKNSIAGVIYSKIFFSGVNSQVKNELNDFRAKSYGLWSLNHGCNLIRSSMFVVI